MRVLVNFAAALLLLLGGAVAVAAEHEEPRRIVVSARGESAVAPDLAVLNLAVVREAKTAREALDANSSAMAEVLAAMKKLGIAERDLQTSVFNISPRYVYPRDGGRSETRQLAGYTVRNALSVRVRDIDRVGEILDKSVTLGVNEGGGVVFTNADPSAALEQARTAAVEAAQAKAATLAQAAGVELGAVLEISEGNANARPVPMMRAEMAMVADSAVPVAQGENSYGVTVQMTFAIDD